jgi:hypothetical protein
MNRNERRKLALREKRRRAVRDIATGQSWGGWFNAAMVAIELKKRGHVAKTSTIGVWLSMLVVEELLEKRTHPSGHGPHWYRRRGGPAPPPEPPPEPPGRWDLI